MKVETRVKLYVWLKAALVSAGLVALSSNQAIASPGCEAVDGQTFTGIGNGTTTLSTLTLAAGDVFSFTATKQPGGTGTLYVYNQNNAGFDSFPVAGTVTSGTFGPYTVVLDGSLMRAQSLSGTNNSWDVSIICTSYEDSTSEDAVKQQQKSSSTSVITHQSAALGGAVFEQIGASFSKTRSASAQNPLKFAAASGAVTDWSDPQQMSDATPTASSARASDFAQLDYAKSVGAASWNLWAKARYDNSDDERTNISGSTFSLQGGADYRLEEDIIVGVLVGYANSDFDTRTSGTDGRFAADSYTVGSYVGAKYWDRVRVDVLGALTFSNYENTVGTTQGEFDALRVTLGAQVLGRWEEGNFFIEPGVHVLYAHETQDAYTDSTGTDQDKEIVRSGSVSVGPKIGFIQQCTDIGSVTTWGAVRGEYYFSNEDGATTSVLSDLLAAKLAGGVDVALLNNMRLSVQGDISGLGANEYNAFGGSVAVFMPF